jgi:uncharacterized protein (DUF488 family)
MHSYARAVADHRVEGSLVSVGYEGREARELIDHLRSLDVSVVVDVRLNAISRKRGLSKTALREALEEAGIDYVHLRALGNPRENRDEYRAGSTAARRRFRRLLDSNDGAAAIEHIIRLAVGRIVAVLCFEAEHEECHRASVIDAVVERQPRVAAIQA